jgi:hypothetical protein
MLPTPRLRRALLLGLPLTAAACDIVNFVNDPKPIFEQTWVVTADTTTVSVASLLPPGQIQIVPDSSAFQVTVPQVGFSRRVGDDCGACQAQHGATTIKPAFVLVSGASSLLPTEVVSAALIAGQFNLQVTNNLSFDPLRVKVNAPASADPAQQGRMVIVIRSGSLVVGRDSINGVTTAFAPGTMLTRPITLSGGNIGNSLAIDLTVTSPASDNNVFINANGTVNATASVPDLRVAQIRLNVVNRSLSSTANDSVGLDVDSAITKHVQRADLEMTITNPFNVTGNVDVEFGYAPGQSVSRTFAFPTGAAQVRTVSLEGTELDLLVGKKVGLSVSGGVSSAAPIDVTPKQVITIANRLRLVVLTGTPSN